MKLPSFRVLNGLPPYGPRAVAFPASGYGAHREGFVVEFTDATGVTWVGNFQPGLNSFNATFETFGGDRPVIIAGGAAYLIDVGGRSAVEEFGGAIEWCLELRDQGRLVFGNGICFEARDRNGIVWRSNRISWDGMRDLIHRDGKITGYAYSPLDDDFKRFELDLNNGTFAGGSYSGPSPYDI